MIALKYIRLILLLVSCLSLFQCQKTDWSESFKEKSKIPFGTYIIHKEAKQLLENDSVITLKKNIYDYLITDSTYLNEVNYANYICIKRYANKLQHSSVNSLLNFVAAGNSAFIALNHFNRELKDSLKFETTNTNFGITTPERLKKLKGTLFLKNKMFADTTFYFDRNIRTNYISKYEPNNTIVLGTQKTDSVKQPIFIKIHYGKGTFYIHTQPIVFTNYFMLNNNYKYAENILSYLPNRKETLWDPQKRSATNSAKNSSASVFKFFLQHPSLTWALFTLFGGLILFLLFNAKRKQRIIPEISKLKNSTVEFAHTISILYLKEDNHKNMVSKKIKHFLEYIRTKYLLNTTKLNDSFKERLAQKTGNTYENTNYLINTIISLNKKHSCTKDELYSLNALIEKFLTKNHHGNKR